MHKQTIAQIQSQIDTAQTVATRHTSVDDFASMLAVAAAVAAACSDDGSTPVIDIGRIYTIACPITR